MSDPIRVWHFIFQVIVMSYCSIEYLQNICQEMVVFGDNLLSGNVNCLNSQAEFYLEQAASIIDSQLSNIYRIPLIKYKQPVDFSSTPITFSEIYPEPIPLINARLASSFIFDNIISKDQEPNVSEWGNNMRSLAYDDLAAVLSGIMSLPGQVFVGYRFVRQNLLDAPRLSRPNEFKINQRQAGK